jgi:tRNA(Arg) A34 adenosine deaminase TadA
MATMSPEELMKLAIDAARAGIATTQSPFGCAIGLGDVVLAAEHNCVLATTDITAHAEITAIRKACRARGGIFLEGAIVATTCEPCPMCMAALHWARVDSVYFGATIADANQAGFNELQLPAADLVRLGQSSVRLVPGILTDECRQLFHDWEKVPGTRAY